MTWTIADKRVLVTGGTTGIGRATAVELARRSALVTITSRRLDDAKSAADEISRETNAEVAAGELDLSSLDSVRKFATKFKAENQRLDVLINNAGIITGKRQTTADGFELTMGVNHFGPFLLTNLLTDLLVHSAPARIINVSSELHKSAKTGIDFDDLQMTDGYGSSKAYAASKLANILFTVELNRRLGDKNITARALHPGVVATNIGKGDESPKWMGIAMSLLKPFISKPEKGAATSVHLATAREADLEAGIYWSDQKPSEPSQPALDQSAAQRLWDLSTNLVGLNS